MSSSYYHSKLDIFLILVKTTAEISEVETLNKHITLFSFILCPLVYDNSKRNMARRFTYVCTSSGSSSLSMHSLTIMTAPSNERVTDANTARASHLRYPKVNVGVAFWLSAHTHTKHVTKLEREGRIRKTKLHTFIRKESNKHKSKYLNIRVYVHVYTHITVSINI